jgi:hypothetical protein
MSPGAAERHIEECYSSSKQQHAAMAAEAPTGVQIDGSAKAARAEGWVKSSDLPVASVQRVKHQYGMRGCVTHAKLVKGILKKNTGGAEYLSREKVRLSLFLRDPDAVAYEKDGSWYVARMHVRASTDALSAIPELLFGSVEEDGTIAHRSPKIGNGHVFLRMSDVIREVPETRRQLMGLFGRDDIPEFPTYTILGLPGDRRYVTTTDLRRLARRAGFPFPDGDDRDVIYALVTEKSRAVAAISGDVVSRVDMKNKGSSVLVSVDWIRQSSKYARCATLLSPAVSNVPIVTGAHPPNRGTKSFGCRNEPSVQSTVKCSFEGKIADRRTRAVLEDFVVKISKAARFGSLLLTLTVAKILRDHGGRFPPGFYVIPEAPSSNILHAMRRAHRDSKPAKDIVAPCIAAMDQVLEDNSISFTGLRCDLPNGGNALKADATMYAANLMTSIQQHGGGRVAALLSSIARLEGVGKRKLVHPTVLYVEGATSTLPDNLPQTMVDTAQKYRKIYAEKGLHDKFGFDVHWIVGELATSARVNAILELYYAIEEDHVLAAERAASMGWDVVFPDKEEHVPPGDVFDIMAMEDAQDLEDIKDASASTSAHEGATAAPTKKKKKVWRSRLFALLPVCSMRRRHVRIDRDKFTTILYKKLHDIDVQGLEQDTFLSLFKHGRKRSSLQLRSKRKGWVIGKSFTTDGTAMSVPFYNSEKERAKAERKERKEKGECDDVVVIVTEDDFFMGGDPGRSNPVMIAIPATHGRQELEGGEFTFKSLERNQMRRDSGQDATDASRTKRIKHHAGAATTALSQTRRRTHRPEDRLRYISACSEHATAFERAYLSRNASRERFSNYRGKTRVVDRFFAHLVPEGLVLPKNGRVIQ